MWLFKRMAGHFLKTPFRNKYHSEERTFYINKRFLILKTMLMTTNHSPNFLFFLPQVRVQHRITVFTGFFGLKCCLQRNGNSFFLGRQLYTTLGTRTQQNCLKEAPRGSKIVLRKQWVQCSRSWAFFVHLQCIVSAFSDLLVASKMDLFYVHWYWYFDASIYWTYLSHITFITISLQDMLTFECLVLQDIHLFMS